MSNDIETDEVKEPQSVEINGVPCTLVYTGEIYFDKPVCRLQIPADQLSVISSPEVYETVHIEKFEAVDEQGEVVVSSWWFGGLQSSLDYHLQQQREAAERQRFVMEVDALWSQYRALNKLSRPTDRLHGLLVKARGVAEQLHYRYRLTSADVRSKIQEVVKEIERLQGDPTELLLDYLLSGRANHPHVRLNPTTLGRLDALAVRSGGFIEPFTEKQLRAFYRDQLGEVVRVDQLRRVDLELKLGDYAPAEILADLDLAPERIEVEGRKGSSTYSVTYGYEEVDGRQVAVGVVRLPRNVYERNASEYGKPSKLPTLPYDIQLIIEVVVEGEVIARGPDGEWLQGKLKKYKKGQQRGKAVPNVDEYGFTRREPIAADQPPPWYHGRAR